MGKPLKTNKVDIDYMKLDDAIGAVQDWYKEIADDLARHNVNEKALSDVLDAMRRVHSPG